MNCTLDKTLFYSILSLISLNDNNNNNKTLSLVAYIWAWFYKHTVYHQRKTVHCTVQCKNLYPNLPVFFSTCN